MEIPGLIDPHVHLREPGATHKEDWDSGTQAALAGGFTAVLVMPNTQPAITDRESLELALQLAHQKARCDFAQFLGAGVSNASQAAQLAPSAAGLKLYLDQTYGPLRLERMHLWSLHLQRWPREYPIVAHAEGRTLAAVILLAVLHDRPLHLAHVSTREEITIIRLAKERGFKITCEVTPHHLFLSDEDVPSIGVGRSEVRPRLASSNDRRALWECLDVIDCFATDHAPHTLEEKDSSSPPPGFPGLETALPLLLTAVHERRLSIEDVLLRMVENPRRIFRLPVQPETRVSVEEDVIWEVRANEFHSKCGWSPFEGWKVRGRVREVRLRGQLVFREGEVCAPPGYGKDLRHQFLD